MIEIGQFSKLEVVKKVGFGVYLDGENLGDILLPNRNLPKEPANIGDFIRVFVYYDSEDRLVATTHKPKVEVGGFAYLKVVASTKIGAFLDWGLEKDVLVPHSEQLRPMQEGHSYLVHIYLDKATNRITASAKIDKFLDDFTPHKYNSGDEVTLLIANRTDLGFKAIINQHHWGLIHQSELTEKVRFGETRQGFIKHIRPDGKIDLTLESKLEALSNNAEIIKAYMVNHGGVMPLHDKSDPKEIKQALNLSKNAFKKAVGNLLKAGVIELKEDSIVLKD